ncbi:MAG: ATP-binding protein [Dolichospermum sp. LBC05a]|nr:ATP-binding protein [Dolichospermum sp. OL01]MCO5797969.1 ATP-binding protein [Dolichospermum sp. OL03]MCS6282470.1 ATP-binding protein [Dolichospermum sp.]QSV59452.1 MAG: ATP-binding protein [Dolichospermum sp. LBC05a]
MTDHTSSYYAEIGGDFKGIQGNIHGGIIHQYIITKESGDIIRHKPLITGSPYFGLSKFQTEDKSKFFGRDGWIRKLTDHLKEKNVLLLLGASGSGKSSLIRAGLIPALKDNKRSVNLTFVPDANPFESFYACLLMNGYKQEEAALAQTAKEDTLINVVKILKKDSQWLIFIDQFEELFTITLEEKRDIFIKSLIQLIETSDASVKIILTMRADFLDKLSPYKKLGEIHDCYSRMLTDMDDNELKLAIAEPAARNGLTFENGLIQKITADFYKQPGSLALLQYTLDLLWDKHKNDHNFVQNRTLNSITYNDLGGVRGALQKHVEDVYQKCPADQKEAVRKIFLKLVDVEINGGSFQKVVSKRANKAEFQGKLIKKTLTKLIDERLIVSQGTIEREAKVEIAHEIILSSWETLRKWIEDAYQVIAMRNDVVKSLHRWEETNRINPKNADKDLLRGALLTDAEEMLKQHPDDFADEVEVQNFINASIRLRDSEEKERELARQQTERAKQQTIDVLTIGLVLALGLSVFSWTQWQRAESSYKNYLNQVEEANKQRDDANKQRDDANKQREKANNQEKEANKQRNCLHNLIKELKESAKLIYEKQDGQKELYSKVIDINPDCSSQSY